MIVTLDHRLFAPGPPAAVRCLQFVFAAQMRQHVLVVDPPWDASDSTHPVQSWLNKQPTEVRETIEKELESGYDEAANMGSHVARIRVENIAASRWESGILAPDDALRTMHTPLWLALENGRNDLQFLRRILERRDREALDTHLAEGRVEVPLGGGTGELQMFLEGLSAIPNSPGHATAWIRRLRSWVMFDRDALPGDPVRPSEVSDKLLSLCRSMSKPWPYSGTQLGRRTIENYLPLEVLDLWAASTRKHQAVRRKLVQAFKSKDFGDMRRSCFDMKKGLSKDVNPEKTSKKCECFVQKSRLPAFIQESRLPGVFQNINRDEFRNALNGGFGKDIANYYGDRTCQDDWFWAVFRADPAAHAWRSRLVDSLWNVL
jgi:hypothetical protein